MMYFTDSCRIERIREHNSEVIKYHLTDIDPPDRYEGSFPVDRHRYDESECNPYYDNSECHGPSRNNDDGATCSPIQNGIETYRKVNLEKYFNLLNLLKGFDKMSIRNILCLGNLIAPEKSSNLRSEKVVLASKGVVDRAVVFPDAGKVSSRLENLCNYVNDNPDNLDRVELASAFAYGFCMVHPFIDGNGRTSRLLANYFLKDNEFFMQLPTDRLDYRKACLHINLTGDLDSMFRYFHKRLCKDPSKVSLN